MHAFCLLALLLLQSAPDAPITDPALQEAEQSPDRVEVGDSGLLDVRLRNVDIIIALELLSEQTQRNIVAHSGVSGSVSMVLRKVTFEEALDTLLSSNNLTYVTRDNVIHVLPAPAATVAEEEVVPLTMRVFRLNYIAAKEAEDFIKPLLSTDGTTARTVETEKGIKSDKEGAGGYSPANPDTLIVVDHAENIEMVTQAITEIDVRPQQVLVEATIMRATLTEQNALGIDFNTLAGVDFQMMAAVSPGITDINLGALPREIMHHTNIAANTDFRDLVPGGGLTFGIVKDRVGAFIRALEQITDVSIMANPKILTLNKQRGEIIVGRRDGYLTTTVTETVAVQTVEYLETGTKLIFRPFVARDGYVRMEIHPEDSNGGLTAANLPFQETTEATTNVLLEDGHTILIGGLFRERTNSNTSQIPGLGNIPVLRHLFGITQDQTTREEVIILLTVHVIKGDDDEEEMFAQAVQDVERVRVGARRGLVGWGREQLAEARYQAAVKAVQSGHLDQALWAARMALCLNPRNLDTIRLHEQLLGQRTWSADGTQMRSFVQELLRREAGLQRRPVFDRPDVDALLREAQAGPPDEPPPPEETTETTEKQPDDENAG
ncbi:MAG: hypothetical protein KKB50_10605 [Planctomycetes bacterium]|nr:hypothetical protein [Planctomycetota bacterium]